MTSPDGNCAAAIGMMQEKAQQWIDAVRNSHLHRRNVWFSLKVQFWPWIGYGLCSSTATLKELDRALHRQYYQLLPLGGIVWTTPVGSRTVDAGFFGVGLPHLGIEALIAMSNKLLALWLPNGNRKANAIVLLPAICRARSVISPSPDTLQGF
jgi:hypothetical protein